MGLLRRAAAGVELGPATTTVARNAVVVAASEVGGKLATLAFTVVAARRLGAGDFGAFAYALSFSLLVATIPHWGLSSLLVKEGSADRRRLPGLLTDTLVWRMLLATPVLVVTAAVATALRPDRRSALVLVIVVAATMLDELLVDIGRSVGDALQDQRWMSQTLVLERLCQAIFGVAALIAGLGLVGLAAGFLAGTAIGGLAALRGLRKLGVPIQLATVRRASLLRTFRRSVAYGIGAVFAMGLFRVDQVMISLLKGDQVLGPYAAAYRLIETVMFISWAAARAVFPAMSASSERWRILRGLEHAIAGVAVIYVPFAFGLWLKAEPVVSRLYGDGYAAAVPAVRWLAVTPLLFAIGFVGMHAMVARGGQWVVVTATAVALAVNVGGNLILIPRLAGTGAAIDTLVSYAVLAAIYLVVLRRQVGWVRLHVALALPVAAAMPMVGTIVLLRLDLLLEVLLGAAVYGLTWLLLARRAAPEQIGMLVSVLRRGGSGAGGRQ
jgi:O-antigen/teichoic acid export membrane protein